MPTRKITRVARRAGTAGSQQSQQVTEFASLVDFLNAVQQKGVSFLPVSSQKGLEILGRGLSGGIQQSRADISTTLAFKEGIPSKLERDTAHDQDWYSLVTEITALQHKPIYDNPHFIDLIGVSFYVEPGTRIGKRAWPLLVTAKVNRGDLSNVLVNEDHEFLTDDIRMQLFAEISEAIYVLHACGISHGDLKPDNILIDESDEGEINCLLIDFGSSTIQGQSRFPTLNEPWNALELENAIRSFSFDELVQTDIFSFGLICLHLLLPTKLLASDNLFLLRRPTQTDDNWAAFLHQFKTVKHGKVGQTLSARLLSLIGQSSLSVQIKSLLQSIVTSTIQPEPGQRTLPWTEILPHIKTYLSHSFENNQHTQVQSPPLIYSSIGVSHSHHSVLDLASALGELDDTDYILRANIFQDLVCKVESSPCKECKAEYAFQVAVYRAIGFGCSPDNDLVQEWLSRSGRTQRDVELAIQRIGEVYQVTGRVDENVLNALGIGVLVSANRVEEYQLARRLLEAEKSLQNEIEQRSHHFGTSHRSLAKLKSELSMVLKALNRLADAATHQEEVVTILSQCFGDEHPSPLLAKINLASTLADQGWFKKAEDIQRRVQPALTKFLGEEHPETITALQVFASTLTNLGQYKEAEATIMQVVSMRSKILTPKHPSTINAELSLVSVLRAQGSLNQALELMKSVEEKLSGTISGDELTKAQLCISQASLYMEMGSLDRATSSATTALVTVDSLKLPQDDKVRITALQTLATIYGAGQEFEKEESALRQVLTNLGSSTENNRDLSTTKCLLAQNLLSQSRLDEALSLANETIESLGNSVTEDPENYVACMNVVVTVQSHRGEHEEAFKLEERLLNCCRAEFGETNSLTLDVAHSLGVSFSSQGLYDRAQRLYAQVLEHLRETSRLGKAAIQVGRMLAVAYREQGNFDEAEKQCEEALVWARASVGEQHKETRALYNTLAATYVQIGKYDDAENLFTIITELGGKTRLDIYIKENLSRLRQIQGRDEEAEALRVEALNLAASIYGTSHPEYLQMTGNILAESLTHAKSLPKELEKDAIDIITLKKKTLGTVHPSTIKSMADLAEAYGNNGRLEDATALFEEIWKMGGLEALQNPQRYAILLAKRADLFFQTGDLEKAEELERKALAIRQQMFGDNHRAVVVSMSNLASTLSAQSKYAEAEDHIRRVITVRESWPHSEPQALFSLSKSRVSLAAVLFFQGKFQESLELYMAVVAESKRAGFPDAVVNAWKVDMERVLQETLKPGKANDPVPGTTQPLQ